MSALKWNEIFRRSLAGLLAIVMVFGMLPSVSHSHVHAEGEETAQQTAASLAGKTVSILGDSISTYTGVSNDSSANSTIGSNAVYYSTGSMNRSDTWWQQTIDALDMELLVNNSWSGSCILHTRSNTVGAYVDRCVQLHNDQTGEEPDVILVFMGTNDFSYYQSALGTADIDYDTLIIENADGSFTYAAPTTSCEAYAIMLHKMTQRYPDAEIYCMTMMARRDPIYSGADVGQPRAFNAELVKIIKRFGATPVDMESCGITSDPANFDLYMGDKRVHPNAAGMDKMTEAVISALTGEKTEIFNLTANLTNAVLTGETSRVLLSGSSYRAEVACEFGFADLQVTVTMGGKDITASCYADGVIEIPSVTADVVVTAQALTRIPQNYRWEFDGSNLVSITDNGYSQNTLTIQGGSVSNGILANAYYLLEKKVVLRHDRPWAVEWKTSGNWSGMLLSAAKTAGTAGNTYLFKTTGTNGFIGIGERVGSQYYNYGIALGTQGVDTKAEHTYRIENRIASNGSNMACLLVDGVDYGAMNHYFIGGSTDQGTTVDWINGKDLTFSYIGASGHAMNNCAIDYIQVWEDGETTIPMPLRYDDHYDVTGKTVEIIDAGKPTSYKVGYGVAEGTLDDAVVTLDGNTLIATGIGTAQVKIDGVLYEVTVTAAPISLLLLIGQSNMQGSEGDANQSIVCPDGLVYSTYGDRYTMTISNATDFAPSALTGAGSAINVNGTTTNIKDWPVYLLNEAGDGKIGPDSGFAYEWVKQTGEKVWVVNAAHGGTNISLWQDGGKEYEECVALFTACQQTLQKEIDAGHFTLSHMGYFWCQGCANYSNTAEWYVEKYLAMHNNLKTELAFSEDVTFEFAGIIPVRAGNESYVSYRQGVYADTTSKAYYESFKDLRFTGPRVAQYWMTNNPELPDIWNVCNIGEDWVWMPDGTNGVTEYFQAHYPGGTVDYTTQVQQSASWYTPTTPKAVHDSIHYNQIGYNEVGREAARNALIMLGEIEAPEVETKVELLTWDGYTLADEVKASTAGSSGTLVVPKVYPVWKSKEVTYQISDGLTWSYYDLLAADTQMTGTLTATGAEGTVSVVKAEPYAHFLDHLAELPEGVCSGLNLWNVLEHDKEYYANGTGWGIYNSGNVPSVTIFLNPGDKLYATSFGKAGTNGHSSTNGIRMTYFSEYGVVKTLAPADVYKEFTANGGYLIAPEGTVAVNIPMWTNSDQWEIYILNREHDQSSDICSICGKDSHTHIFSDWETVTAPSIDGPGEEKRSCACGETETRKVDGAWQKFDLANHMQTMPENYCCATNLWTALDHDAQFLYYGSYWAVHESGTVYSVTIPVKPGDRIFATSFQEYGKNGNSYSTSSGIRVTFLDAYGVAKTLDPAGTYAEFTQNGGYLIAPEGAVAVNIPMWTNSEKWEIYILNREHDQSGDICSICGKDSHTHEWSNWETVTAPSIDGPGEETRSCACGETESREVKGVWQTCDLTEHMSPMPDAYCAGTNLWAEMEHDKYFYSGGTNWGIHSSGTVYSVTIPVNAGDKIYASSFGKGGTHGGSSNGIRVTFFDAKGVNKTLEPAQTYAEFTANGGYLIAPEGTVAINIPMWTNSDQWEIYILNREHSYENGCCTICGQVHPEAANYSGKVISILGDSISTFAGYIPVADGFNLEHVPRYPQDNLLTDVNETWWMQVLTELDAKLGINESWRSTEVGNIYDVEVNSGFEGTKACMASLTRIQNLGSNGTPDVILFYGGTNDITQRRAAGTFDPETAPTEVDLTSVKWDTVADAYVAAIMRMQYYYPDAEIVAMLPTFTYKNTDAVIEQYNTVFAAICAHYGVTYIDLRYCGITTADLPDGTHPDAEGMDYITDAVLDILLTECDMEAGENVIYTVTHDLEGAQSSLSYYKGVSAGSSFYETVSGDDLTVTVIMGGADVTAEVYSGGVISIANVTGDLVITAAGKEKTIYEDSLQQLPDSICCGTNLWDVLEPENKYYTSNGWGNLSSGQAWSVTIPVSQGDHLYATSFEAYGSNGNTSSTSSGIRVTYFDAVGVYKVLTPADTYAEFTVNGGYLVVPEGAVAVNVPMWTNSDQWEIYILNREHDYSGTTCTICGQGHPEAANYSGKVISILGDSISTFAGYIPTADGFNLEHLARYPQDNLLTDVNETWWMQVVTQLDAKLGINDSWRGSTVSGYPSVTTGVAGYLAAMSNLTQIQNLGSNGTPDVILFYGGTNDLAHTPKLGSFDPATAPTQVDLTTLKWDNMADGYVNTLLRLKHFYPDAQIVCLLPTYTASYYSNDKLAQGNALLAAICEHYGVAYVDLRYCGISTADLPDGIHPDATGMDYITAAVLDTLLAQCEMEAGENKVYSVSHTLSNVEASLGYYKGISAGKPFAETLTSDGELTVTVTMGGKDITAECYADGTITVASVTGDLVITAKAAFSLGDRLQQLPDPYYGVNLWPILKHDADYYSVDGWTVHSSGKVKSVTIPVIPGQKLYASSFEASGTNGSSTNGIRVTFFSESGMLISMSADAVYKEFKEKGYVTVPEGANAVNIPMWTDSNAWELYIYNSTYEPSFSLGDHLLQLPDALCAGTNLWTALDHESVYYDGTKWTTMSGVYSVTIPLNPGDQLWATSFGGKGQNGSSTYEGIRVTFFGEKGMIKSLTHSEVYGEFVQTGYITAPEGTTAVNVPMWTGSDSNELYLLNREHIPGEPVKENEGTDGSHELAVYCEICGQELSREAVTTHIPGDITGDGEVNNKDLTRLFKYLTGYEVEVVEAALDVNGDGSVNNKDQTRLFRYLSGWDVEIY